MDRSSASKTATACSNLEQVLHSMKAELMNQNRFNGSGIDKQIINSAKAGLMNKS